MSEAIVLALDALSRAIDGFDPRRCSGDDAARLVERCSTVDKMLAATRVRAALRASECGAHRARGHASAAEWLARQAGTTSARARDTLHLAGRLGDLPDTERALARGELSLDEAQEIDRTEQDAPGSEREMVGVARRRGLRALKERGKRLRQAAHDEDDLARRRHRARGLRMWDDELGMVCGTFRLLPHHGAALRARLDAEVDRAWRAGDGGYRAEPREARAADALVSLFEGKGKAAARPEVVAVWDLNADRAHLVGGGRLDHETLRDLAKDALVSLCLHDGVDVQKIVRLGRSYPVALRVLMAIGPPPDFTGASCAECGRRYHLERDHIEALVDGGLTTIDNLQWLCPLCHLEKTVAESRRRPRRRRATGSVGGAETVVATVGGGREPPP